MTRVVHPPDTSPADKDGWVQLFNGRNLTGWKPHPLQPGKWRVENGILIGSGATSHLFTVRGDYKDFHLRVEARINVNGDGGVVFRCSTDTKRSEPFGYEAEIAASVIPSSFKTGSLYCRPRDSENGSAVVQHAVEKDPIQPDTWFTLEIIANGNRLTTLVDGKQVASVTNNEYQAGFIALQVIEEETVIQFRKIEIKELPPSSPVEPWVSLFNGKDLTGWKTHPKQPEGWSVENNTLVGKAGPGNRYLFSERGDYENFHFRVEAKISEGGDAGQLFRCEYGFSGTVQGGNTPLGYEANISRVGIFKTGTLWGADWPPAGPKGDLIAPDTWFTQEVIANGDHIVIKVNGKTTVDYVGGKQLYRRGHLAFQAWEPGTVVQFRKIEIKELLSSPKTPEQIASEEAAKLNGEWIVRRGRLDGKR